ncbi:MAG: adenylate/guanylate cyclase domain-containing protein [Kiloniellales bacterium]
MSAGEPGRRRRTFSLSRTMTVGLVLLLLGSAGASFWLAWEAARRNTYELLNSIALLSVNAVAEEVNSYVSAAQVQVKFLGGLIARGEVEPDDIGRLRDLMLGALAAAPQVSGIAFVRPDFSVIRAGSVDDELIFYQDNWGHRPEIRESMENVRILDDPTWRAISYVEELESTQIIVAEGVSRDGELIGLLFSVVSTEALSNFLADYDRGSRASSFVLFERDKVVAHSSLKDGYSKVSQETPLPTIDEVDDPLISSIWGKNVDDMSYMLAEGDVQGRVVEGEEDSYIYLYRDLATIGLPDWTVGVAFRGTEVEDPFQRLIGTGVVGVIVLLLALVIGLYVARSIVRPLRSLASASHSVSNLEFNKVGPLKASRFRELDVAAGAFNAMVAGLRCFETYVPRSLVLRMVRSGGDSVQSEERAVTVLFTDIVGFTGIGANLAPAELATFLNDHFTLLAEAIEEEEGTVDKYIGDSIMAFWGAPFDQPDHAERACRAALKIAHLVRADNQARRARGEEIVRLRIGLHSGAVVAGNIGAPGRVNYTLIGDTVNSAQRLEALGKEVDAEAEVIVLLGAETKAALPRSLAVKARGIYRLRGRAQESEVFQLLLDGEEGDDLS